jgi:hypothetical protein
VKDEMEAIETQDLAANFLGVVFVIMDKPSDASRVIEK